MLLTDTVCVSGMKACTPPSSIFISRIAEGEDVSVALRGEQKRLDQLVTEWRWASPSFAFVCYYIRRKSIDISNLRLVCLSKLKGISGEVIFPRLRQGMIA